MTSIVVGVEGSVRSQDAVAFARRISEASGARIKLAHAYPYDTHPSRASNAAFMDALRDDAEATLERMKEALVGVENVETVAIADVSPARALQELAERDGAALVVLGSTHHSKLGRVLAGTTAERLLHGSPCPVAVVPHGFCEHAAAPIETVAVGHDGSKEAEAGLSAAVAASRSLGAALRVVRVFSATEYGMPALVSSPGFATSPDDLRQFAHDALDKLVTVLKQQGVDAEPVFISGDPVSDLVDESRRADLMFLGSRAYGPLRAVLLGEVSGRVVLEAECPVIVVPRGVEAPLAPLFAAASASLPA